MLQNDSNRYLALRGNTIEPYGFYFCAHPAIPISQKFFPAVSFDHFLAKGTFVFGMRRRA
jgi:hypothetical protein